MRCQLVGLWRFEIQLFPKKNISTQPFGNYTLSCQNKCFENGLTFYTLTLNGIRLREDYHYIHNFSKPQRVNRLVYVLI